MTIYMVDSIESPQTTGHPIPEAIMKAQAVLGYSAGNSWPSYKPYCAARPKLCREGWIISTTLTCVGKGRCYDIEPGGGTVANIPTFMHVGADRTFGLPILYTFASQGQAVLNMAAAHGWHRGRDFYYLSSHANEQKHICHPDVCGYPAADGSQYTFRVPGNCDGSILYEYVLPSLKPADPNAIFPTDVHDKKLANRGNERKTVEQAKGALQHPVRYHNYLKGVVYYEIKGFRDHAKRVSLYEPPSFTVRRAHADWSDERGKRWQLLNDIMKKIARL